MRGEFRGVTDHFAVMGLSRAAWIDAEELKERFHRLSAARHPDAGGGSADGFAELNAAWQTLRDPVSRLRHFLELTAPGIATESAGPPAELGDLFMEIAGLKREAQQFSAAREKAASPLARAILEPARLALVRRHTSIAEQLSTLITETEACLRGTENPPEVLCGVLSKMTFLRNWERHLAALATGLAGG
ncbi:MAG: hypothetical protein RL088_1170 [Verrucomicrobiota bacterium]